MQYSTYWINQNQDYRNFIADFLSKEEQSYILFSRLYNVLLHWTLLFILSPLLKRKQALRTYMNSGSIEKGGECILKAT